MALISGKEGCLGTETRFPRGRARRKRGPGTRPRAASSSVRRSFVAQTSSLSVSAEIVADDDDFWWRFCRAALCRGFPIRQRWTRGTVCRLEVGDSAGWKPALRGAEGSEQICLAPSVAQTSSLLYRGFPIRRRLDPRTICRLEVGDTADWKSSLPGAQNFDLDAALAWPRQV